MINLPIPLTESWQAVFIEIPSNLEAILNDINAILPTLNASSVSPEHHIVHKAEHSGTLLKFYSKGEVQRPYNSLVISTTPNNLAIAQQSILVFSNRDIHCLVSREITPHPSDGETSLIKNIKQLSLLHDEMQNIDLGRKGYLLTSTSLQQDVPLFSWLVFDSIEYLGEMKTRSLPTRSSDLYERYERFGSWFSEVACAVYDTLFNQSSEHYYIHGDARNGNIIDGRFIDFDHLRLGPKEYDFGRLLADRVYLPFAQITEIIQERCDHLSEDELWRAYFHHNFILGAQALAEGDFNLFSNYAAKVRKLAALFGGNSISELSLVLIEETF